MNYLLALIAFLSPTYLVRFEVAGIPSTLLEVLIWAVFIHGLFLIARDRTAQARLSSRWMWLIPAALIELGAILGILVAPDTATALGLYKGFILDPMLVYLLALAFLHTKEDLVTVVRGLLGGAGAVAVWSLLDAGGIETTERVIGPYVLDANASPNYLAFALAPILPFVVWLGWESINPEVIASSAKQSQRDRHTRRRGFAMTDWVWIVRMLIVGVVILLALYASASRAGLAAGLGGLVIALLLSSRLFANHYKLLTRWLVVGLLIVLAASWFAVRPNFDLSPEEGGRITASNNVRWQLWSATGELVQEHWLLGTGLGGFQTRFTELTADRVNYPEFISPKARTPHNLFVGMWMETGLLGLAGMFMILVLVGKSLFTAIRRHETQALAAALLGSWFVLLAHGLVDQPIWKNDTMVIFWLLVALSAAVTTTSEKSQRAT